MVTLYRGLVAIRHCSFPRRGDLKVVNALAEALHNLPVMMIRLESFRGGETELLDILRLHLREFDEKEFPEAPVFSEIFEREMAAHTDVV